MGKFYSKYHKYVATPEPFFHYSFHFNRDLQSVIPFENTLYFTFFFLSR